jgi:hypothetical protein
MSWSRRWWWLRLQCGLPLVHQSRRQEDPDKVIKVCPNCAIPIQRSSGCDHVTCKYCDKLFDWRFATRWNYRTMGNPTKKTKTLNSWVIHDWVQDIKRKKRTSNLDEEIHCESLEVTCRICLIRPVTHRIHECGHTFCEHCLHKSLTVNPGRCPKDNFIINAEPWKL